MRCEHVGCTCETEPSDRFCSDHCREHAGDAGHGVGACGCGHPQGEGSTATADERTEQDSAGRVRIGGSTCLTPVGAVDKSRAPQERERGEGTDIRVRPIERLSSSVFPDVTARFGSAVVDRVSACRVPCGPVRCHSDWCRSPSRCIPPRAPRTFDSTSSTGKAGGFGTGGCPSPDRGRRLPR